MLVEIEQGSKEWLDMRCGSCTASRLKDVIKKLERASDGRQKGEPAQTRDNYLREIVCERLTNLTAEHFVTQYMEDGAGWEPVAREEYEMATGADTKDGGYALHPRIKFFGASPDFRVGDDGLGEIKCLKAENHYEVVKNGFIPPEYLPQMCGELACTERQWIDFVAFNPNFPKKQRLFIRRLERNVAEPTIAVIEQEVEAFLADVAADYKAFLEL